MSTKAISKAVLAIALATPVISQAADFGIYAKGGTMGLGGGVGVGLTDSLRARLGYTTYKVSKDVTDTDVNYHGDFKLGGGELLLDWHPFGGTFRLTGGLVADRNKVTVDAKPTGGTYTINDTTYNASEIGSLDGEIKFKSTAPYLGIGWGDIAKKDGHFSFVADIGVLFQGSPNASLNVNCGTGVSAAQCTQIRSDVQAEEDKLNHDMSSYKYWPVINFGVAYHF